MLSVYFQVAYISHADFEAHWLQRDVSVPKRRGITLCSTSVQGLPGLQLSVLFSLVSSPPDPVCVLWVHAMDFSPVVSLVINCCFDLWCFVVALRHHHYS